MRRPILNNSSPGQTVYEPSLIVAQTTGRVCLAVELDPLYVNVAVRRWQAFTGRKATLGASGGAFDDIARERLAGAARGRPCGESGRTASGAKPRGKAATEPAGGAAAARRRGRPAGSRTNAGTSLGAKSDSPRSDTEEDRDMRGRRPKPTRLKVLTGNPGKRALNLDEPRPDGAIAESW